jgi:OmpA-OmpF porin, OOP family
MRSPEIWVTVKGKLVDAKTGQPIGAKIIYEKLPDGTVAGITQSDPKTGEYEIKLPAGHLYGIRAEAKDHISENQNLDLRNITSDTTIEHKDFTLSPIQVAAIEENVTITLNNIFFDFDKTTLKSESFPELNRIVDLMNGRTTMQVDIAGHADATGETQYNLELSKRRAQAVQQYLIGKGIAESRISTSFYGESKPVESNASKEGRRKNRRVEFKIVKP